jgi:hypothetical protein
MFAKWLRDLWGETVERWLFLTGLAGGIITFFPLDLRYSALRWTGVALTIASFAAANFKLYKKLREELADEKAEERRRNFKVSLTIVGHPPSQTLSVEASDRIEISRLAYMLTDGTTLASDDLHLEGETVSVNINEGYLAQLFNAHRPDKNPQTFAGPIKLRLTVSAFKRVKLLDLPASMAVCAIDNTWWKTIAGSETFHGI